jgi:hypothetical protein
MGVLLVILVLAAIAGGVYLSFYFKRKRREALAGFARQYGMTYSPDDTFGIVNYPFHLFSRGDGRGCENIMYGDWKGMPVQEADYWYYEETTDSNGRRSRSYSRFSVVVANAGVDVPAVSVEKENLMTRLADHVGLHDIEFESEDFNRAYNVKSGDREFCFKLIDARMMQWMLGTDGQFGFEVAGPRLLVYCKRRGPTELVPLLGTAKAFNDHIPNLVRTEFPGMRATERSES